jgi:hypothetical protein
MTDQDRLTPENPFSPHSPANPKVFVNREREVDLIFGHLKATQRGNVAVSGPLGIGKTSLLRYVASPAVCATRGVSAPRYAVLYVDVHSVSPFTAVRFWHRVARLLSRLPGIGADLGAPIERLVARDALDVTDIEEFLDAIADHEMVLVLLLDEFEWAIQGDTLEAEGESRNYLAQLASLARRSPRVLSLIVATEAPLVDVVRVIESWRGSPFPTVFTSVALRALGRADADMLLDRALADAALSFGDDERNLLFRFSAGQPGALQAAAFALFHGRQHGLVGEALWDSARQSATEALDGRRAAPPSAPPESEPTTSGDDAGAATALGLHIDPKTSDVSVGGVRVESLTALEYNLLKLLYDRPGRLCSKEEIIARVWGDGMSDEVDDSRVEKLISRLRRKIEAIPNRPQHIRTVRGRGYRFVP